MTVTVINTAKKACTADKPCQLAFPIHSNIVLVKHFRLPAYAEPKQTKDQSTAIDLTDVVPLCQTT